MEEGQTLRLVAATMGILVQANVAATISKGLSNAVTVTAEDATSDTGQ